MNAELLAKCSCLSCGNHIEFPIEVADSVVPCPHCNEQTQLTLETAPPASSRPTSTELIAGFSGPVPRTPISFFYQLGLVLVTITMIILPLVYLALVLLAVWSTYFYATHFHFLLTSLSGGGRLYLLKLVVYLTPIFTGAVLVFFMIKPLFASRGPRSQPLALNPALEKELYAFIATICDTVGAPMPKRIDLDCQINAAAGFRRGLWSLFGNDLVLTIGVPLVAGLNLREFAGVIAHEFGHFTQGFGMRLSYIIRSINGWFARVVYERDAWDLMLDELATEAEDWRIMLIVNFARVGVWFSRMLLMALMYLGHGISCFLLRQMEYDADSYEIKLAGSAAFESTARRLAVLNEAQGKAYQEMRSIWNVSQKLPDNFPAYVCKHDAAIPTRVRENIQDSIGLTRTSPFQTHPSDGDRIRRARQAAEPGIFGLEMPATVLFSHFDIVAKQITQIHYSDELGIPYDATALRPVEVA